MKKLQLRLEDLAVESFGTREPLGGVGTVRGYGGGETGTSGGWKCTLNDLSCDFGCDTYDANTCPSGESCQGSCDGSCILTCELTCAGATCDGASCYETFCGWSCPC